jgi:hypothetical protein
VVAARPQRGPCWCLSRWPALPPQVVRTLLWALQRLGSRAAHCEPGPQCLARLPGLLLQVSRALGVPFNTQPPVEPRSPVSS